ncbi:glycerol-3-phosphate acyltransferase [Oceanobacillus sp. CAU 1775]
MYFISIALIGYLFGCMNGSQIIGKYKQINIKNNGSKNAGATNTFVLLGWKSAAFVAFVDIFKAILSLTLVTILFSRTELLAETQIILLYINALFVIVGHNYPITMNFSGGKGTASFLGVLLFFNWKFALVAFILFLIFSFVTNYFVIGTFIAYLSFVTYTSFIYNQGATFIAFMFTVLFVIKHLDNIKRIMNKEEVKLSSLLQREATGG